MKSIIISIHPKYCGKIFMYPCAKSIEIRKNKPRLELPFKCYIYCTKPNTNKSYEYLEIHNHENGKIYKANGNIIGEFTVDRIDTYSCSDLFHTYQALNSNDSSVMSVTPKSIHEEFVEGACISYEDAVQYCKNKKPDDNFYGWHINNPILYAKPFSLVEFYEDKGFSNPQRIVHPPQSWMYFNTKKR